MERESFTLGTREINWGTEKGEEEAVVKIISTVV